MCKMACITHLAIPIVVKVPTALGLIARVDDIIIHSVHLLGLHLLLLIGLELGILLGLTHWLRLHLLLCSHLLGHWLLCHLRLLVGRHWRLLLLFAHVI